jgi:chromosomal replication initiation ATPase DnaA
MTPRAALVLRQTLHDAGPTVAEVAELVSRSTGVSLPRMQGPSRLRSVVRARHMAIQLSRKLTDASHADIAEFFNRHRDSVRHAIWKERR